MARLNPKILEKLKKRTKMTEGSIRASLSEIRKQNPGITLNAAAQIFARKKDFSVNQHLSEEDRKSMQNIRLQRIPIRIPSKQKKRIIEIAKYETNNRLLKAHLIEINKTYTFGCYTACFGLMRKVLENLLLEILRKKYPKNKKKHREKYYDFNRNRVLDFSKLIENLRKSSKDFGPEKNLVERICQLADGFKETANEMTHSLYHLATKREIDEKNFQYILDLIEELENKMVNSR